MNWSTIKLSQLQICLAERACYNNLFFFNKRRTNEVGEVVDVVQEELCRLIFKCFDIHDEIGKLILHMNIIC